ncbi:MAG: HAD family hydrolase [Oligoflexia bacterium]|nr:HAD family hydrolase [Oligoflexia bacterium]
MQILEKILNELKSESLVIFDLDSTLFDVSPRITAILKAFASEFKVKDTHPEHYRILTNVEPHPQDYGVRRTLERYNFPTTDMDFIKKLVEFWKTKFFSSDYLHHDRPYLGAHEFTKKVEQKGAEILYLTGRDSPRMKEGTISSLIAHQFPLDQNAQNLILKPSKDISDAVFKQKFFENLKHSHKDVYFFENEPLNIHLAMVEAPFVKPIFVETVHSQKTPEPSAKVPRIKNWKI